MTMTGRSSIGVFDEAAMADRAIEALQQAGFRSNQIHSSRHPSSGGFLASLKSLFTGDENTAGSVANDLSGMGISDEEAQYYAQESQKGHTVVAVQAENRVQEAMDLLQENGAFTYAMRPGTTQRDERTTETAQASTNEIDKAAQMAATELDGQRLMKLREEQLTVDKQRVQTGEVRLRKDVVAEQKTIDVPISHEEVYLERRPVTDGSGDVTTPIGEAETIRVPLSEEQIKVTKETIVTGEVAIGKRAVEETRQVKENVRQEEARLEQEGDAPIHGTKSDRFHPTQANQETS
ncbi:MAG TPA: YsnF/AvaK domain-containing protein [Ktedonobacteraceae bacterium]|nr:YsnF/AvaK domain-containing protein [Ktedonobacteraceae bacterium]